jgi:hypothetical protein
MNHMTLIARFAALLCGRFTVLFPYTLPAQDSIQQISDTNHKDSDVRIEVDCDDLILDKVGTLTARAHQGLRASRSRIARSVALAIGISMSIPMASADSGSIDAITPRDYVRIALPKKEAVCLARLIGKESAWNSEAVGNLSSPSKSYTYGLLQLKNPIARDKSPIQQIHLGLKYIDHRYDGDTCKAWLHWKKRGWH